MTHNPRILPDAAYAQGSPIPASWFQALDGAQAAAVNGDAGGVWAPAQPIFLSGAGWWLAGPSTTSNGATIVNLSGSGKRLVHASDDVVQLIPGHTLNGRALTTSCLAAGTVTTVGIPRPTSSDVAPFYAGLTMRQIGGRILVPLEVHNLATFTNAHLSFYTSAHTQLPDNMPSMRIIAVDAFGDVIPLGGTPGSQGYVAFPAPAGVTPYSNNRFNLIYPINSGAGLPIDKLNFTYYAEIVDESGIGAVAGNTYLQVLCNFSNIASLYFP